MYLLRNSLVPTIVLLTALIGAPSAHAQTYTLNTIATFNSDNGYSPYAGLTLFGGTLYGTTQGGGANDSGTVFSVPVTGGMPTTLANFNGDNGDGPTAGLTLIDSTLYGTTEFGGGSGSSNGGTVYSVTITGGALTTLATFNGIGGIGRNPYAGLTLGADGRTFYGTTESGGAYGFGTVYSVPMTGGTPTTLATFNSSNGSRPYAGLTLGADGTLYGTTRGDAFHYGTVFSVPMSGGAPTTLAAFNGSNGKNPEGGLTLFGGTLYGTASGGGASDRGTVFSVPNTGGALTTLANFSGSNGVSPYAGLILIGSTLYGTTEGGGDAKGDGTVFSLPLTGGMPTTLAVFNGSNGSGPVAGLTLGADGTLYGTTVDGGAYNDGTVFSLTLNGPAAVPEASTTVSLGLLLVLGLGGVVLARKKRVNA